MAIHRVLERCTFSPEEIEVIASAYEDTVTALGFTNCENPATRVVAQKIMQIARSGERNPVRIRTQAIAELGISRAA